MTAEAAPEDRRPNRRPKSSLFSVLRTATQPYPVASSSSVWQAVEIASIDAGRSMRGALSWQACAGSTVHADLILPFPDSGGFSTESHCTQNMKNLPFFSVIVPTHKRARLLRRALQSIRSQASPVAFEVIVVSDVIDAGTDAVCAELLSDVDIYVRRNGLAGPSESRNLALTLAKGQYVLFLDDDDAWHPSCLDQLYAQLAARQGDPVYFNCSVVKERRLGDRSEELSEAVIDQAQRLTEDVYVKNQIHMSCFALPRVLLDGLTFDSSMRAYEDWDFLLSVFDRQMPVHVPILGSRIFEVDDESSDRRGSSKQANDFNAVLDYLYVYRRHPAPQSSLKQRRSELLRSCGILVGAEML